MGPSPRILLATITQIEEGEQERDKERNDEAWEGDVKVGAYRARCLRWGRPVAMAKEAEVAALGGEALPSWL